MIKQTAQSSAHNSAADELEIDLVALARYIWARKRYLFISTAAGGLLMLVIALSMRNVYESQVLLAPAQDDSGRLASLAGQFGGLASLAGVKLGGGDQMATEGIALFTSRDFLLDYIREKNLKPIIFYKNWDSDAKRWKQPSFIVKAYRALRNVIAGRQKSSRYSDPNEPTDSDTYDLFTGDFISVKQDKKTSFVTVSVRAYSPEDAQQWTRDLVYRVNERLRTAKKNEAEKSIAYLQKASEKTSLVEAQKAMYDLVEAQTKTIMFANAKEEFAFQTIDPAFYPEQKVKPRRTLMLAGGLISGLLIALMYLFVGYVRQIAGNAESNT